MIYAVIVDVIALLLVLIFVLIGAHKGFVLTLCGMLAWLVALVGAWFVAQQASPWLSTHLEPALDAVVSREMEEELSEDETLLSEDDALWKILQTLGLEDEVNEKLNELALAGAASVKTALVQVVALNAAKVILYIGAFLVILFLWFIVSRLLDLAARLPGLNFINRVGGAVLGAGKGLILTFFLVTVLTLTAVLTWETIEETYFVRILASVNPLIN